MAHVKIGAPAPEFWVQGPNDSVQALSELWADGPLVVIFLRHFG